MKNIMKNIHPGKLAFFFSVASLLPQLYKVFETNDIDSFSLVYLALSLVSNICWILNGVFYTDDMAQAFASLGWVLYLIYIIYLVVMQRIGTHPPGEAKEKHHIIKGAHLKTIFK